MPVPIIEVMAVEDWCPPDTAASPTSRQTATKLLGESLCLVLSTAHAMVYDLKISPHEIRVDFKPIHPASIHTAEVWIIVRLSHTDTRAQKLLDLRETFAALLVGWMKEFRDMFSDGFPAVDVNVVLDHNSGVRINPEQQYTSEW